MLPLTNIQLLGFWRPHHPYGSDILCTSARRSFIFYGRTSAFHLSNISSFIRCYLNQEKLLQEIKDYKANNVEYTAKDS